ncbi:restriction endonuclease [Streptomyces sp. RKAG293]|uniref:restriction endonuclease n=1 Tax=Streptomyces sp. RKAG293 TaxID=2893403 RepID=UPI00203362E8|nr:restriction endonuclease [Streptomyces sp. RKAG293]MCM2420117.1 restriction endonuclease [Streptomyces sp. RKAG293]
MNFIIGQKLRRSEIHDLYKGNRQKGIAPSRSTPDIFLFSYPEKNREHGYADSWGVDGHYHYTGEGQEGDQEMTGGNLAVLQHHKNARPLHLFRSASSGVVEYLGEFSLDDEPSWYRTDTPDSKGELRSAIMFRLKPVSTDIQPAPALPAPHPAIDSVTDVDVEQHNTSHVTVKPSQEPREAERREALLVTAYRSYLESTGVTVKRKRISLARGLKPLYTDLHNVTSNVLIEGKGSVARESIRMAIGQLFDYQRYLTPTPTLALLVPLKPDQDMIDLCSRMSIEVIWPEDNGFTSSIS